MSPLKDSSPFVVALSLPFLEGHFKKHQTVDSLNLASCMPVWSVSTSMFQQSFPFHWSVIFHSVIITLFTSRRKFELFISPILSASLLIFSLCCHSTESPPGSASWVLGIAGMHHITVSLRTIGAIARNSSHLKACFCLLHFLIFERGPHHLAQTGLKFTGLWLTVILLPQCPQCWDYRETPPQAAFISFNP